MHGHSHTHLHVPTNPNASHKTASTASDLSDPNQPPSYAPPSGGAFPPAGGAARASKHKGSEGGTEGAVEEAPWAAG